MTCSKCEDLIYSLSKKEYYCEKDNPHFSEYCHWKQAWLNTEKNRKNGTAPFCPKNNEEDK
jgi:hypothetical protein